MKKYLKTDEWNIIEDQFHPDRQRMSESIFSLGNYNPQIEMFARFKMKSSFHKTKRII